MFIFNPMKTKIVTLFIHVTAWVIFLSLPFIFRPKLMGPNMVQSDEQLMFLRFLVFNSYLIGLFYLHGYWMMPKLLLQKHWLIYGLILVGLFILFIIFREQLFAKPRMPMDMKFMPGSRPIPGTAPGFEPGFKFALFKPERGNSAFLFIVILLISGGVRIVQEWMKVEKRSKLIESERMAMELSLLRSQINPHFLFNTLNSIYSLALMKSDMTAHAVMQLSDIMRYMTEDSSSEKVILSKEVDYIQHYVELQRIRLGINTPVILTVEGEFGGYFIPPLILMPFVENAFKYGISNHEQAAINIFIRVENHHLLFQVKNLIFKDRIYPVTTGLGITNTRKRLERIYPGRHTLDITENSRFFMVTLTLQLV